jgi:flagellar basal-body rod protein FlgG
MDRGIYAAGSGGFYSAKRMDIVANNLANANTVGFKAERLVARKQEFADTLASKIAQDYPRAAGDHERTPGVTQIFTETDFTPGPISNTGNGLNVALAKKNTFFVIETPEGERYTRAGNFSVNSQGNLVTADGFNVQGDGGPLTLPPGKPHISSNGTVSVNGEEVGRLRTVRVEDLGQLKRSEGVRFELAGGAAETVPADVIPESVEMPNISVVESMVEMINAQRGFEAYTKSVVAIDVMNERAIRNLRPNS